MKIGDKIEFITTEGKYSKMWTEGIISTEDARVREFKLKIGEEELLAYLSPDGATGSILGIGAALFRFKQGQRIEGKRQYAN
jgi:hypothetical protein